MKNLRRKIIIGAAIAAVVLIALFVYFSRKVKPGVGPLTIVSSNPVEGASEVSVFDPVTITFNQPVSPKDISVTSNPEENWTVSQNGQSGITIGHELYLRVATIYKLTISQNGSTIGVLNFKTATEQNDPRQLQGFQSELKKNYPLATLTPYETPNYRVVYSAPLTLEIDIKSAITPGDAIVEVKAWVKSNGIDPTTHKYIVVSPSPTP